ncbi:MAG: HAMP domain-containing sensor histidine kinase [Bdellovibrionia bacterium]
MTHQGSLHKAPGRKFRQRMGGKFYIMLCAHLTWLGTLCLLVSWWGRLVLRQADRIASLEGSLGLADAVTQEHWHRIQRMLYWESSTFFALLLGSSGLLCWLYWRDHVRARGVQAFFASVTHELRTPLTGIRLQAESIADLIDSQKENQNLKGCDHLTTLSQRLLEDSMRLESQVDRTLELARVEGGGPVFTQPLQIKPWLDRFLKNWSRDYTGKIQVESKAEDLWIQADPAAVQVIFKNLLENSVKHSKKDKVQVTISTQSNGKGVLLQLKDNGQGYRGEAKSLGKLFQKGPSSQGTGVGLYLIQVLMQRMGGGARFAFNPGLPGFEVQLSFKEGRNHD